MVFIRVTNATASLKQCHRDSRNILKRRTRVALTRNAQTILSRRHWTLILSFLTSIDNVNSVAALTSRCAGRAAVFTRVPAMS